jgi:spore maturation protein CgeB
VGNSLSKSLLYVAPLDTYAGGGPRTSISRLDGLRQLHLDIDAIDSSQALGANKWTRRCNRIAGLSSAVRRMNALVLRRVRELGPGIVWLDRAEWMYPWTLRAIRRCGARLVYYNTDDAFSNWTNWNHWAGIHYLNLYATTNRPNVSELKRRFGCATVRVGMGFDEPFHKPVEDLKRNRTAVFIGHYEPNTERYIAALKSAGVNVQIWGQNWRRARRRSLRDAVPLDASEYVRTIASSGAALCFLSRWNRNESTGRSLEIPAIGGLLVAEYTAEHDYLYGACGGAVLFHGVEDCVRKVRDCLQNPESSARVARIGHERCMQLGLSWQAHMRREWPIIAKILEYGPAALADADDQPFWHGFRVGVCPGTYERTYRALSVVPVGLDGAPQ